MKNRKKKIGFTLIELLAVIIVLAIIALIATPIIFNVIENAKLKSLENSCYGVIDAVRTKYAEGLLNSEDGTVKLSGDVKDITVSGEQPIEGTWKIDNSSDSDNRGIKIKDVKFASMKDYTCTNVNSDGTINSKVTCTKGGSDDVVETDLSCFEYKDILDYDIDIDRCISYFVEDENYSKEKAEGICNNTEIFGNDEYFDVNLLYGIIFNGYSSDVINGESIIKLNTNFTINTDGCVAFLIDGEEVSDEDLTYIKGICNGEIPVEENVYIKEYLINSMISGNITIEELEKSGMIEQNYIPKKRVITKYTCDYKDVVIPRSVNVIFYGAFNNKGITSVDFSKSKNLSVISGYSFTDNQISSLSLPNSIVTIEGRAFENNQLSGELDLSNLSNLRVLSGFNENQLTSIKLPSNVTMINGAFSNNQLSGELDITDVTSLKIIGNSSFKNNQLTSVILPDSVTTIDSYAFDNNQLTNLKLPVDLVEIGFGAFENNKLNGELNLSDLSNLKVLSGFNNNQLTNLILPDGVTKIDFAAFSSNKLTDVKLVNSITTIGGSAFDGNQLTSVTIPNNVTIIGNEAFSRNQLTDVTISNSVTTIGMFAFSSNKLTNITIPNSVTSIGSSAFESNQLTSITIPNSVTTIGAGAFYHNSSLKSIKIDKESGSIENSPWGASNATVTWLR